MSDNRNDYSWLSYLPDNFTNSGRILGGFFTVDNFKELGIIVGGFYMLTRVFLERAVSAQAVWGIRIGFAFLVLSLNMLIRIAFNESILGFLIAVYEYTKLTKKYRYERRDAAYVRRKKEGQTD